MSSLASKGVSAACICGSYENEIDKDDLVNGNYQIIFFTPESLILNHPWRRMLSSQIYEEKRRALVVDEAHTVQKWLATQSFHLINIIVNNSYI